MVKYLAFATLVLLGPLAHAGLGDPDTEIERDRQAMSGVMRSAIPRRAYTVYEIATPGRTIREYVSRNGVIFAIAWQGINQPDLSTLLGSYYGEFQDATARQEARGMQRRSHHRIESARISVARSGHMRSFSGKAIVSALLPEGVTEDEIR